MINLKSGLFLSFLAVTCDLLSTKIAIDFFNCYEINPLGNKPLLEYSVFIFLTFLFFWLSNWLPSKVDGDPQWFRKLAKSVFIFITISPFIAVLNNTYIILSLL